MISFVGFDVQVGVQADALGDVAAVPGVSAAVELKARDRSSESAFPTALRGS